MGTYAYGFKVQSLKKTQKRMDTFSGTYPNTVKKNSVTSKAEDLKEFANLQEMCTLKHS